MTRGGLAGLVEGQDLQLGGEVDLADVHVLGHRQHHRREVQDAGDPGRDEPVAHVLGDRGRGGQHRDRDLLLGHDLGEVGDVAHDQAAQRRPDPGRVGVDQRGDAEAAAGEPGVPGQRLAEVADADQGDRAVHRDAERARDLLGQRGDVVADAADAVGAEVGQVLAQLGRVHAGRDGELLGGDGGDAAVADRAEHAQIGGQPGDGGVRDAAVGRDTGDARALRSVDIGDPVNGPFTGRSDAARRSPGTRVVVGFSYASDGTPLVNLFPNREGRAIGRSAAAGG